MGQHGPLSRSDRMLWQVVSDRPCLIGMVSGES